MRPKGVSGPLPAILYIHGAGWVFGNAHTHDRLIRLLATRADAAVVFPKFALSPEAKYPIAIEHHAVARWIASQGNGHNPGGGGSRWPVTASDGNMSRPSP